MAKKKPPQAIREYLEFMCDVFEKIESLLTDIKKYDPQPRLFSSDELVEKLGVSKSKSMSMTVEKTIPHLRAGSRYLFDYENVKDAIKVGVREKPKPRRNRSI